MRFVKKYNFIIDFINARKFKNDNPEIMNLRQKSFRNNLNLLLFFHILGKSCLLVYNIVPLVEQKNNFGVIIYFPIDFEKHQTMYYLCYIFVGVSTWMISMNMNNGCMLITALITLVRSEFKILGDSFEKLFDDVDNDTCPKIYNELKNHVRQHNELIE